MTDRTFSRKHLMAGGISGAAALSLARLRGSGPSAQETLEQAMRVRPASSNSVQHVVFLMHENRSFDHYFGKLGGVNGFDAPSSAFAQAWPGGANSTLLPFHLDTSDSLAECTYDLSHAWQAQHASWN